MRWWLHGTASALAFVMLISSSSGSRGIKSSLGFTLLEVCFALAMLGIFISGLMSMHSHLLGILRTTNDNVSATQALQERIEQMRIANWVQITDANYLTGTLLATGTASAAALASPIETISISAYPPKTGSQPIQIVRQKNKTSIVTNNLALKNERMIRVDVEISWEGFPNKRKRTKATAALIAKGGISK